MSIGTLISFSVFLEVKKTTCLCNTVFEIWVVCLLRENVKRS